ncbi:trimeric LpxA-like protein [Triangularia verruculosa]|uniref:Trimeric LpxA-like protein n=1 Tax=Triangularia verruculosa TaxID=2587418 RepID=A0AAN7AUV8_9PEZI|nr:trimeric LpxA-like protein [Triangularia verruculosa]
MILDPGHIEENTSLRWRHHFRYTSNPYVASRPDISSPHSTHHSVTMDQPFSTAAALKQQYHGIEVSFPAGNNDFRAVRNSCAAACRAFNSTPEDADAKIRGEKWLDIVKPGRPKKEDGTSAEEGTMVTHDQAISNPALKATIPFVKPPLWVDYGTRLKVASSTFINRNCVILDTPVADLIIGERCNIGTNCTIVCVGHPVSLEGRRSSKLSTGAPVTIGNDVWIGANVTILPGVSIGNGAVIGAGTLVNCNIPPMTLAVGSPVRLVKSLVSTEDKPLNLIKTVCESTKFTNSLPMEQWDGTDSAFRAAQAAQLAQQSRRGSEQVAIQRREEQRERLRKSEIVVIAAVTTVVLALLMLFSLFFFAGLYLGGRRGCIDL